MIIIFFFPITPDNAIPPPIPLPQQIKSGMIFTIEPMINLGNYETKTLNDGWTAVTKDKSLSAQFEHTIGVTKDGYEIFTKSKNIEKIL